tara:strand:+ start:792 stop:1253 length:462 start_codon:yes stop_codon:yes gene_type:complete
MNIRVQIEDKYKAAIKSKNIEEANILRLIKSAIKDEDIVNRSKESEKEINNDQVLTVLQKLIKQRKDSIDSFQTASRNDLIEKEQKEIDLIISFLPKQLNDDETKKVIEKIINDLNLLSIKDMGKLMNNLKTNYSGSVDMSLAGKIAKDLLNN